MRLSATNGAGDLGEGRPLSPWANPLEAALRCGVDFERFWPCVQDLPPDRRRQASLAALMRYYYDLCGGSRYPGSAIASHLRITLEYTRLLRAKALRYLLRTRDVWGDQETPVEQRRQKALLLPPQVKWDDCAAHVIDSPGRAKVPRTRLMETLRLYNTMPATAGQRAEIALVQLPGEGGYEEQVRLFGSGELLVAHPLGFLQQQAAAERQQQYRTFSRVWKPRC